MTDPAGLLAVLQNLKAASDIVKGLRSADVGYEKAELKLKIADLAELLADARISVLDAQEEIRTLEARIQELEASEDVRDRLVKRDGVYYVAEGDTESGPYCPRCFEADKRRMPLTENPRQFQVFGKFKCPECEEFY